MFYLRLFLVLLTLPLVAEEKTVFLTILARNKAHLLPKFLECIDRQDYDKSLITVYINTNNNDDNTVEILENWIQQNQSEYHAILFEEHHLARMDNSTPHEWTKERLRALAEIRNKSLKLALEMGTDYYFVVDCDNFITPCTLKYLVEQDKPIIAPMLISQPEPNDPSSNFFAAVSWNGYWADSPDYYRILYRDWVGTFKVPLVHCTYLINSSYLNQLSYTDLTDDYEFIIFSRTARRKGVGQYICNEEDFGVNLNFFDKPTREEEARRFQLIESTFPPEAFSANSQVR